MSEEENKGPSLGELIETTRFLGREFLAWMWFESSLFESQTRFGEVTGEIHFEKSITLETSDLASSKEKSTLVAFDPSGMPEAREALRQGKLPTRAKIVVRQGEREFSFVLDAASLGFSGMKTPAVLKQADGDDPFFDRMGNIEEIEGYIEGKFGEFLGLRLTGDWDRDVVPAMREWMREEEGSKLFAYRDLRGVGTA